MYKSVHPGRQQLLLSGTSSKQVSIDWDLPHQPLLRIPNRTGQPVCNVHPGRQQLLLSGTSSKLDKSVLIGTCP
jgi:hypothetical protein